MVEGQEDKPVLIFASDAGIEVLQRAKVISVDGTFSSSPPPFLQLFIIMATLPGGSKVPAVFGLLPDKRYETYAHFFQAVADLSEVMFKGIFFFLQI